MNDSYGWPATLTGTFLFVVEPSGLVTEIPDLVLIVRHTGPPNLVTCLWVHTR